MVGIVFVSSFNWYYMHGSRMCITDTKTKLTELVVSKIHGGELHYKDVFSLIDEKHDMGF